MKKFKKITSVFLAFIMFFSMSSGMTGISFADDTVSAETDIIVSVPLEDSGIPYFYFTSEEPEIGQELTVKLMASDVTGVTGGTVCINYPFNYDYMSWVGWSVPDDAVYTDCSVETPKKGLIEFTFSCDESYMADGVMMEFTVLVEYAGEFMFRMWQGENSDLGTVLFNDYTVSKEFEDPATCDHANPVTRPAAEATCCSSGYTESIWCTNCGTEIVAREYTDMLAHTDSDNNNTCDVCGSIIVLTVGTTSITIIDDYTSIPFTPEKTGLYSIKTKVTSEFTNQISVFRPGEYSITVNSDESGNFSTERCFIAGSTYNLIFQNEESYDVTISLIEENDGHKDDNIDEICDYCGISGYTYWDFTYEMNKDNNVVINGYIREFYAKSGIATTGGGLADFNPVNLVIPTEIYTYYDENTQETVYRPVTEISDGAFVGINTMQSVEIPSSVTSIGKYAFGYTESSDESKIDGFVIKGISDSAAETYANENGFTFESLYTYEINNGEATITGCSDNIGNDIDIPAYINGYPVTAIGDYAFANKDLDDWTIPDTVVTIGEGAFENNHFNDQYSMFIPASVETIGDRAFANCDDLCSVYFGGNAIKSIGNGAFEDSALMYIDFKGTPAAWDNITIGENNELIESALKTFLGNSLDGYYYEIKNNEVIIYSCYLSDSEIVIPDTIEGCPVTTINAYAIDSDIEFTITKITIPASVVNIEDYAIGYYYDWELKDNVASKDLTIVGVPGSAAETYANENGFKFEAIEDGDTACQHVNTTATPGLDATCTADGYTQSEKCDDCGAVLTESVVIPATGHKDSNKDGYCDACNEKLSNDEPSDVELFKPDADFTESNNKQILTDVAAGTTYGQLLENSNADRLDIMSYDTVTTITSENSDDLLKTGDVLIFFDADGNEIGRYISELEGESYVDYDSDGYVTSDDAIYYLKCQMVPGYYPITGTIDFDSDGYRTTDDAIYLLKYTMVPELYDIY